MSTRIDLEYDRQFGNAEVQEIIARATVTINVLLQLGTGYQNLPGMAMGPYQNMVDSLEADLAAINALLNQILTLLISVDAKAGPLNDMNKRCLKALTGMLMTAAEKVLLDQITGATAQGGGSPPSPPPPTP